MIENRPNSVKDHNNGVCPVSNPTFRTEPSGRGENRTRTETLTGSRAPLTPRAQRTPIIPRNQKKQQTNVEPQIRPNAIPSLPKLGAANPTGQMHSKAKTTDLL